ncbi:hypothetical protein [Pseudomonas cyclaminis]|uniref:hypothetical protein n=1 Tax=Pseudomonas cyclaminis TaxID=2781239 RepID=UPI00381F533A
MTDYTDLQKAAEYAAQDTIKFADESEEMRALQQFHEEVDPETVLALIAENQALKGPHDWLAEDLIKELVDNAQAIQENADDGEEDRFVIVLLAAASRIRRQEANIDQLKAENEALRRERDARHPFKPFHEPAIGFTGCVICGVYTDHGGLPCPKTRATADASMGKGERS